MAAPRVSVITIFLDEQSFLADAVNSVLSQSFQDWELLLVDDGSTDASSDIASRLAATDGRIHCHCHPGRTNRGMSASRNLGVAHASGEFIGFLDADDIWIHDKLAEQIEIFEREPAAALVYGRTLIWYSWDPFSESTDFLYELGVEPDRLYSPPLLFELLLRNKAQSPTTCNALIRRGLFAEVGGFEESFRGMFEDQVFFAKALLHAKTYVDSRIWAKYRQHRASCTAMSATTGREEYARLRALLWMRRNLQWPAALDEGARSALTQEIWRCRLAIVEVKAKRFIRRLGPA
jgi:glycosyltransferase involved in cell wall biosynthesis